MNRLIILIFVIAVSGCSKYHLTSNIDKENFDDYFRPSQVTVYEKQDLAGLEYSVIGAVEGSSCQEEQKDTPADPKEARTKARINAYEMHANGIVFQSCIHFPSDETCVSNVICYGRALEVAPVKHD